MKATHNEVTIEIGKLAKDIQSTKDILMKEIRKGLKDAEGRSVAGPDGTITTGYQRASSAFSSNR